MRIYPLLREVFIKYRRFKKEKGNIESPSLSADDVLPEDGNYGPKVTINVMDYNPPNALVSNIVTYRWKSRG